MHDVIVDAKLRH